jgi:hypothetical protein
MINSSTYSTEKQWKSIFILLPLLFLSFLSASAQTDSAEYWKQKYFDEVRMSGRCGNSPTEITNVQMVGIGLTNMLDTYISAEKYRGTELRYISHTTRRNPNSPWSRQLIYQGDVTYTHNRADNGNEMAGMFNFSYGKHYNWQMLDGKLDVKAGALADLNLGFIYNTRNSNNPGQMKAYFNITPSVEAAYHFNVKRTKLILGYELDVPLAGIMFSPNYGQSYYEIFSRGNYDHNIVPTTFISAPSMRQMLSLDVAIGKSMLRIGYLGDYQQADVNNLKSHIYTHALIIGVVKKFSIKNIRP